MKKYIIIVLFLCGITAFAQEEREERRGGKIDAMRVAFITERLDLTPAEAEKFWPVFNAFHNKEKEIRKSKFKTVRKIENANLTEKEAALALSEIEKSEIELHENRKTFIAKLKQIIPALKIIKLKKAEDDFNRQLLKRYRNNKD
jgi:Spy/CpxP family protein refolding chaperone